MSSSSPQVVIIKLFTNKNTNKVIYAESGKDFVNFLFHVFMLPVGAAMNHLVNDNDSSVNAFGLSNLYKSINNFAPVYLQDDVSKVSFLKPTLFTLSASSRVPLWPACDLAVDPKHKPVYVCPNLTKNSNPHNDHGNVHDGCNYSYDASEYCQNCGNVRMSKRLRYFEPSFDNAKLKDGYVKGQVTYMITDDLVVKPLSSQSIVALLLELGIKDVGCIKETDVTLDSNQGMALLKASLTSKTVLTDIFLAKNRQAAQ